MTLQWNVNSDQDDLERILPQGNPDSPRYWCPGLHRQELYKVSPPDLLWRLICQPFLLSMVKCLLSSPPSPLLSYSKSLCLGCLKNSANTVLTLVKMNWNEFYLWATQIVHAIGARVYTVKSCINQSTGSSVEVVIANPSFSRLDHRGLQ